jgi:hypothetical protein
MRNRSLLVLVACGALNLNAQGPACTMEQPPGAMTSWAGQPGAKDHIETRTLPQGTALACEAVDAPGSILPAGCNVSVENGGHFNVPVHNVIRTPKEGAVTLMCNGPSPNCCRAQITEDKSPLKRGDTKPHKQQNEESSRK